MTIIPIRMDLPYNPELIGLLIFIGRSNLSREDEIKVSASFWLNVPVAPCDVVHN